MNKKLVKIFLLMLITYLASCMIWPAVFPKSYQAFDSFYLKGKTKIESQTTTALPSVTKGKINVLFILDDGWKTQYTVGYDLFNKYGVKANIAVVPSLVGKDGYVTLAQLSELYINGWDMLNHTFDHYDLNDLNDNKKTKEFNEGRSWLEFHEFVRAKDVVVFPGGYYNQSTIDILNANKYKSARSLTEVWNTSSKVKESNVNIIILDSYANVYQVMKSIDDAINKKQDIIFVLHKLEKVTTDTDMQYDPENVEQLLKYINSKKDKINVVTYSQWLNIIK